MKWTKKKRRTTKRQMQMEIQRDSLLLGFYENWTEEDSLLKLRIFNFMVLSYSVVSHKSCSNGIMQVAHLAQFIPLCDAFVPKQESVYICRASVMRNVGIKIRDSLCTHHPRTTLCVVCVHKTEKVSKTHTQASNTYHINRHDHSVNWYYYYLWLSSGRSHGIDLQVVATLSQ